ncbi:AGAP006143-PC [Anopheles gambiae str. PEST]|uniref:Gustatory receptor n=1 Tax=Anopheles gambiae TaxID=7165 RepID=A7UU28_ANOGA|nr:AGAP006143-PC [Anopheles gambiae str. PEST]
MHELQFLNIFNYCFVSPTYLHFDSLCNRYEFQHKNVFRNVTLLIVLVTCSVVSAIAVIVEFMQTSLLSVIGASSIILYTTRFLVMIPLTLWVWLCRHQLISDNNVALNIIQHKHAKFYPMPARRRTLQIYWIQVGSIVILLTAALAGQCITWWEIVVTRKEYFLLNVCALVALEILTLMHRMYIQCWALVIAHHLDELVGFVKNKRVELHLLRAAIVFWEELEFFKQRATSTFRVMNVLHVLDILITCVVETYTIFYVFEMGLSLVDAMLNVITLTVYAATFFMFAYAHDLVKVKEAELKDALKSMQYTNLKRQSRDQKDFYDLVNLKLMMESPKITACGLFEINLQIFYNVFAAIITYIVILFQFRGFEKSP